jgi:hypothetical protein
MTVKRAFKPKKDYGEKTRRQQIYNLYCSYNIVTVIRLMIVKNQKPKISVEKCKGKR